MRANRNLAADAYTDILSSINQKKTEVVDPISDEYSKFFIQDKSFAKKFYDYFSLSGATLVLADNLEKRVVLLQDGVRASQDLPKLSLPVYPKSGNFFAKNNGLSKGDSYSEFVNRIFQIQRHHQGLQDSPEFRDRVTFKDVPEFFDKLPSLNDKRGDHYFTYSKSELLYHFVLWRFFVWLIHQQQIETESFNLNKVDYSNLTIKTSVFRNGSIYLERLPQILRNHVFLPEHALENMGKKESWHSEIAYTTWLKFRNKVDVVKKSFVEELETLNRIVDKKTLKEFLRFLEVPRKTRHTKLCAGILQEIVGKFMKETGSNDLVTLLKRLHNNIPLVIPYFYFSVIDERLKSHAVFSVWHSDRHPIRYFNEKGELTHHTSVLNCVASLNDDLPAERIHQLTSILKLASEPVINTAFVERVIRAEQRSDSFQFERNILLSRSPETLGVFILGTLEERVTFLAQQSRAINLIRALKEFGVINDDSRIAVIGGGLSGVAAGIAAKIAGVKNVNIFEAQDDILRAQLNAKHRYIHPYIYDWPNEIYEKDRTILPFLNWTADNAPGVLGQIKADFVRLRALFDRNGNDLIVQTGEGNTKFERNDAGGKFRILSEKGSYGDFDIVIMAVGLGSERNPGRSKNFADYWTPDVLQDNDLSTKKILIAGSGDSALIDLIRAALKNPEGNNAINHKSFLKFTQLEYFQAIGFKMLKIDNDFAAGTHVEKNPKDLEYLYKAAFGISDYNKYGNDKYIEKAIKKLMELYRANHIDHLYRNESLKLNTALLHRLLVFLLKVDGRIFPIQSKKVTYKSRSVKIDSLTKSYDYVLHRVGLNSSPRVSQDLSITSNKFDSRLRKLNLTNYVSLDTVEWYKERMREQNIQFCP